MQRDTDFLSRSKNSIPKFPHIIIWKVKLIWLYESIPHGKYYQFTKGCKVLPSLLKKIKKLSTNKIHFLLKEHLHVDLFW